MRLPLPARALAIALGVAAFAAARPAAAQLAFAPSTPAAPSLTAAPTVTSNPTADGWTGVYRVEARNGGEAVPMRVIVERAGDRLDAMVLIDNRASALDRVSGDEDELRAVLSTSEGRGELVLRPTATGVTGTLKVGKTTWKVAGERSA